MKLDNDTIAMLDFNTNISERPQDQMEYSMSNEDQFIFDEEWDYMMFTPYLPQQSKNYLYWWRDKVAEAEETSTYEEDLILSAMTHMLEEHVLNDVNFNKFLWQEGVSRMNGLLSE